MTGPEFETENPDLRPVSVAELLARNGSIGAPAVTRRRRRRRGDDEAVTVAELTGEIPIIEDDDGDETDIPGPASHAHRAPGGAQLGDQVSRSRPRPAAEPDAAEEDTGEGASDVYWAEPEPRWPKSPPQTQRRSGPQRSAYPRPLRYTEDSEAEQLADRPGEPQSDAEDMSPDPIGHYGDLPVDVMDSEVSAAEPATQDSAYVRSYLRAPEETLFGGQTFADEMARRRSEEQARLDADVEGALDFGDVFEGDQLHDFAENRRRDALMDLLAFEDEDRDAHWWSSGRVDAAWRGGLVVLQSIVAVAFGAGLFIAFDQLWRWNSIVTLVLSVLVILGLVVGVRVVRKTEDIASTLIAVAVGALITWGPLVLSLQSG